MSTHYTTREGVSMPKVIYGTAWKKERTTELVDQALSLGFRGIDTACQPKHYQEDLVGRALAKHFNSGLARDEVFIQTKYTPFSGQDPARVPYDQHAPLEQQVEQSFARSIQNLGVAQLDSWVLHSQMPDPQDMLKVWHSMENFREKGQARQLGISNCYDLTRLQILCKNARFKPAVVQNRFYKKSGYDIALRKFCEEENIIYQSFWTLTANTEIIKGRLVGDIAKAHQRTRAQVFFRALIHLGIAPLTGTCSEKHMREDLELTDFQLSRAEVESIDKLFP